MAGAGITILAGRCVRTTPTSAAPLADTVVVTRTDTLLIHRPTPVSTSTSGTEREITARLSNLPDSFVTVSAPVERHVYADSSYRAVVSGIQASLDTIEIYRRELTTTITRSPKEHRWVVGPSVGVGWNGKSVTPYVGITLTYRFISF